MTAQRTDARQGKDARRWSQVVLLALVLLGFGLRLYRLDGQSMWSDEGLSLYRARQPLDKLLSNIITVDGIDTVDTNPPLYFLLLHYWRGVAGESVFGLRLLGALAGTMAVPLMYVLGKRAYGRLAGLAAALLLSISPFHVWQSQVLRNYGLLVTLNLMSVYGLFRFALEAWPERGTRRTTLGRPPTLALEKVSRRFGLPTASRKTALVARSAPTNASQGGFSAKPLAPGRRPSWGWLVLWGSAGALGIYTHYFGFFVFAYSFLGLVLAYLLRPSAPAPWRRRWIWLGLLVCLALIIPAVPVALSRFDAGQQIDFYQVPASRVVAQAAGAYGVGMEPSLMQPWWRVLPSALLLIAGIYLGWRRRRLATALTLGYQIVPLGIIIALSNVNPLYNGTRHLLIGLPPFLLLVAVGCTGLLDGWKERSGLFARSALGVAVGLCVLVIAMQANWLKVQFTSPALVRDDVRGFAEYLNEGATTRDVVVLHDTLLKFTFDAYYHGAAPVVAIPPYGEGRLAAGIYAMEQAARGRERVWFLTEPEPRTGFYRERLVEWADYHWQLLYMRRNHPPR